MQGAILGISTRLIEGLDTNRIEYCHWKNNHNLDRSLAGEDDLDILVSDEDYSRFVTFLATLGFKEGCNKRIRFPSISHFYGLDADEGKVVHLHAYRSLVTGESHIKNHHLPLERLALRHTRRHPSGCRVPEPEVEFILFVLRYYIKLSCLPGAVLLAKQKHDVSAELDHVSVKVSASRVRDLIENHFQYVTASFFEEMTGRLMYPSTLLQRLLLGCRLRWKVRSLRRLGTIRSAAARYYQLTYRTANKVFMKEKKSLVSGGAIIAITGLDASGKSTVNNELARWLSRQFNVRRYHVGRPRPRIETLAVRAVIKAKKSGTRREVKEVDRHEHRNLLFAFRHVILAYERFRLLRTAAKMRDRGYIVVCDRYPSLTFGVMDSCRIGQVQGRWLYSLLGRLEGRLYAGIPKPDAVYDLRIPLELALARNRARTKKDKETDDELEARYSLNSGLQYRAYSYDVVDASPDLSVVLAELKRRIWKTLGSSSRALVESAGP